MFTDTGMITAGLIFYHNVFSDTFKAAPSVVSVSPVSDSVARQPFAHTMALGGQCPRSVARKPFAAA